MAVNEIGLDISKVIITLVFIFVVFGLIKTIKGKNKEEEDSEEDNLTEDEFIKYLENINLKYKDLVHKYEEISDELIEKIKKLLSEDAGYFDYEGFNFDLNKYNDLVEKLSKIEDDAIKKINNHKENVSKEEPNIMFFFELYKKRKEKKESIDHYLERMTK